MCFSIPKLEVRIDGYVNNYNINEPHLCIEPPPHEHSVLLSSISPSVASLGISWQAHGQRVFRPLHVPVESHKRDVVHCIGELVPRVDDYVADAVLLRES